MNKLRTTRHGFSAYGSNFLKISTENGLPHTMCGLWVRKCIS